MLEWSFCETETTTGAVGPQRPDEAGVRVRSMHEDVPDWYDCCSCEAEPYWAELAEEPGRAATDCEGEDVEPRRKG